MKRILGILISFIIALLSLPYLKAGNSPHLPVAASDTIKGIKVDTLRIPVIPPSSGVQFYKNGIIFLSPEKNERKMASNHISFGNVEAYFAAITDTVTGQHYRFSSSMSFPYPCEAVTFSKDYKTMYFTALIKKYRKEKIFSASLVHNDAKNTEELMGISLLSFCNDDASYTHPAISNDGSMLIFSSDRLGSAGGLDLYISRFSDGKWSEPQNMGSEINTSGNEYSAFLDSQNNLFFSSDKLPGYGGYDIFTCRYNGHGWEKPENLGPGVNTSFDEIAFTMNRNDDKTAIYTRRNKDNMQSFLVSLPLSSDKKNLIAVFNPEPVQQLVAVQPEKEEPVKTENTSPSKEPEKKEKKSVAKEKPAVVKEKPAKKENPAVSTTAKVPAPAAGNYVVIQPSLPIPADQVDKIIFRVQILSSSKPKKEKEIVIAGKSYPLYEFYYLGAYRYCVGEFSTLQPAMELQKRCREAEYKQAFAAAFRNNTRTVDLKPFR